MTGGRYDSGEWNIIWKSMYYMFLLKNKKKLEKTIYVRNLNHLNNMEKNEISEMRKVKNVFVNKYVR
jgi:deoxyribodipyrimidine photolyase-like uncharacterized protein